MDDITTKKGEEGKCNYGDWTTLKPKHYRYHHIKIFKKEKIEINKKTGMNGDTFKNIIKKKKVSSLETVGLCSPKVKNTVEMSPVDLYKVLFC